MRSAVTVQMAAPDAPGVRKPSLDPPRLAFARLQYLAIQPGYGRLADAMQQPLNTGIGRVGHDLAGWYRAVIQKVSLDIRGDGGRAVHC